MTEIEPIPLLQIIHVTDLHVQKGRGDKSSLAMEDRKGRLWLRELLEKRNAFGWHDGTLGHDETAERAFRTWLQGTREKEPEWFSQEGGGAETWLIDTGDASTSGDRASLVESHALVDEWISILQPCGARSIFGNHDAWPGTHPAVMSGPAYDVKIEEQRALLGQRKPWDSAGWLPPLATSGANGMPRIECYAINTVCFDWQKNLRALGEIDDEALSRLKGGIIAQGDAPAYRILMMHHPLCFPYERKDRKVAGFDQMVLLDAERVAAELLNAASAAPRSTRSPYVHLVLSGHTHLALPGQALPENVKEAYQGDLGRTQLQLVSGSLMLLRSANAVREAAANRTLHKDNDDFSDPSVFDANQQFQLLRFFFDPALPDGLWLQRWVMARVPNSRLGYAAVPELVSDTFVLAGDQL